jgi:hypothetical protein
MTTIALVGAGRGLGAAIARTFGKEGFDIALLSRSQDRVDAFAAELTAEGFTARGYAANVRDPKSLITALDRAGQELSPIEVLTYSPLPQKEFLGRGSILFINGGSGARPNPNVAGTSIAFAGESAYARMLHDTLAGEGIQVGQLIIPGAITPGHPTHDPDVLAGRLWHLHTHPDEFRVYAEPMPE